MEDALGTFWAHALVFLSGSTALGLVAHGVNTFPTPQNVYGRWFLGVVQFLVGQRIIASNTLKGLDTIATSAKIEDRPNGPQG